MPAMLPLFWKTRERLTACVLVLLIFIISLVSAFSEFMPARASSPLWHSLQASTVHTSNGSTTPFVPPNTTSTQANTDVPSTTPTDPPGPDRSTPTDNYPTSTDYPPANPTSPVADQPSYPNTQPTSPSTTGSNDGAIPPTNPPSATKVPTPVPTQPVKLTATPTNTPTPAPAQTCLTSTPSATPTPTVTPTSTPSATDTPTPTATATSEPAPALTSLEQVTDGAFGQDGVYVPNSWGVQKSRIVRTSTGDIFTVYIDAGTGPQDRTWHLMHRISTDKWEELKSGDAGTEPINILVGPNNELHLFAWPGTNGTLAHWFSTDLGKTFKQEDIAGRWSTDQGYSGATINANGDMVVYQTAEDVPGHFLWSYYSSKTQKWTFHINTLDCRYTYAFFFLGDNNDLTITAMRDVERPELGLTASSKFNYIFNAIGYFYTKDVTAANPQLSFVKVTEVQPKNNADYDITYLTDSYIDTSGRVHILYNNLYDGLHHVIIENGKVVKNVKQDISQGKKARITQDSEGRFYLITMSADGNALSIYPGSDSDTDGTQLLPAAQLDISQFPGCSDDDFCHSPTFTVPRSGNARSDTIDGVYGNYTREIYFQIDLYSKAQS